MAFGDWDRIGMITALHGVGGMILAVHWIVTRPGHLSISLKKYNGMKPL